MGGPVGFLTGTEEKPSDAPVTSHSLFNTEAGELVSSKPASVPDLKYFIPHGYCCCNGYGINCMWCSFTLTEVGRPAAAKAEKNRNLVLT